MKTTLEVEIGQVKQRDAVVIIVCTDGGIVPGLRYEVHRGCKGTAFPRNFCVLQNAFTGSKPRKQEPTDHFILPNHPEIHEKIVKRGQSWDKSFISAVPIQSMCFTDRTRESTSL